MSLRNLVSTVLFACTVSVAHAQSTPPLSDPAVLTTVMQFTAKDKASIPELKKRMAAIAKYVNTKSNAIEGVLMQNANEGQAPHFVGVSRWRQLKDWEMLWTSTEFQRLVSAVTEVGELKPGVFAAAK